MRRFDPRDCATPSAFAPLRRIPGFVYDKLNRRTQVIDARGGLTSYTFDAADNLTRLQDAASPSNWTTFAYDKLNRRTQQTDPLTKNTTFAYDAANRRTSSTDRLGRVRNYSYDALDRLKGETWVAGAGSPANTFTFTYDAADNLRSAANAAGTYTLTYDKLNRVTYEQQLFGLSLTFSYDASDNRTRVDDSLGGVTTSVYDDANRLTRREFGGTGQTPLRIDVAWTDRNQLETLTRYQWNAGAWQSIGSSVYHYDAAMRLDNLQHRDASSVAFSNTTYGYDVAHRLTSEQYNGGTAVNLGYDPANQLTSATGGRSESYGYDLAGNRNTSGYQTGTGNRLLNDGTYAYTYNDEGARDKKTLGPTAETFTYGYDHNNRLVWARQAATDGGAATLTVTYTYDAFGQRVQEERWTQATGVVTTRFAFDGANIWADLNNANQLLMRRLYLDGVDQVFARLSAAGTAVWYASDRQGSITDYLDTNGTPKYHFAYDSFGTATGSGADPSIADRLRYTGKEYDQDIKLQLYNWRWYDPRTGRWVNEDPIGLRAGDANLHRYVGNSPTNGVDPSGLSWNPFVRAVVMFDIAGSDIELNMLAAAADSDPRKELQLVNERISELKRRQFQLMDLAHRSRHQAADVHLGREIDDVSRSLERLRTRQKELLRQINDRELHLETVRDYQREAEQIRGMREASDQARKIEKERQQAALMAEIQQRNRIAWDVYFLSITGQIGAGWQKQHGDDTPWYVDLMPVVGNLVAAKKAFDNGDLEGGALFLFLAFTDLEGAGSALRGAAKSGIRSEAAAVPRQMFREETAVAIQKTAVRDIEVALRSLPRAEVEKLQRAASENAALRKALGRDQIGLGLGRESESLVIGRGEFIGGAQIGQTSLSGLRDARNLTPARLQAQNSTCGLHAGSSVISDVNPVRVPIDFTRVRDQIRGNAGCGLDRVELMEFLGRNLPDAVVVPAFNVTETQLLDYLRRGYVIAHVDGNHWVRVLGTVQESNTTWLRIYDPARGNYEQLLTSFMTRTGSNNVIISVRP